MNPEIVQEICDEQYFHWLDLGQVEKPKREILERMSQEAGEEQQQQDQEMEQPPSPMKSQAPSQGIQDVMQEMERETPNEGAAQEQAPAEGAAISEEGSLNLSQDWLS